MRAEGKGFSFLYTVYERRGATVLLERRDSFTHDVRTRRVGGNVVAHVDVDRRQEDRQQHAFGDEERRRDLLIEVGTDHRLADPEPLTAMLKACEEVIHL